MDEQTREAYNRFRAWSQAQLPPVVPAHSARILGFPGTQEEPSPKRGLEERDDWGG